MLTTVLVNYNHGRYLPESLGSILNQTRLSDELIVIDDASTDNSVEIITSLLPRHRNARLVRNPVNQGCFANVNDGLRLAKGTYVHFASADDLFYPRMYEVGMALLSAYPDAAVFTSRSDVVDETGRNLNVPTPFEYPASVDGFVSPAVARKFLMSDDSWFMGNTALFRRADVLAEGGFPVETQSFADGYMCRFLALKSGCCFSPEILAAWRRLDAGFASSISASLEKTRAMIAAGERKMRGHPDVFPAAYVTRWKGRQEFDTRRRMLADERLQAAKSSGRWTRAMAGISEKIRAAVLLIRLCPWDLPANMRHRLALYRRRPSLGRAIGRR